jgi:hypothetical protein
MQRANTRMLKYLSLSLSNLTQCNKCYECMVNGRNDGGGQKMTPSLDPKASLHIEERFGD